ncbi:hypothetical protein ACF1B0_16235 [Streptomyces anandii]|uniref:hypothetical protein n=1 Tax=Streptomyces anandii TaxID=285454 RepID=UPI0036FE97B3
MCAGRTVTVQASDSVAGDVPCLKGDDLPADHDCADRARRLRTSSPVGGWAAPVFAVYAVGMEGT